jgi:ABC-2 type transport system ATP-binding protein
MPQPNGAIVCQGLTKHYGAVQALRGLDLVVPEGAIFGFLGPNGAGKTTTIKLLTGLSRPTAGRAWVAGQEVAFDNQAMRAHIGYLAEEPAFYGWMSGREFLTYLGRLFGLGGLELTKRVDELLELADLVTAAKRRIGGYSRGMRQRLGIAQAMINRPAVLFLDEPCSALDPLGRKEILQVIARLRGQATVFMSTHILADVERACDTVGIIDQGRLVVQAPIEELRERYAAPVFLVEVESSDGQLATLADNLRQLPWVARVEVGENRLRLSARDLTAAKREMPGLVAASGLTLLHYELTLPSLEDVFVQLVEGEKTRQ